MHFVLIEFGGQMKMHFELAFEIWDRQMGMAFIRSISSVINFWNISYGSLSKHRSKSLAVILIFDCGVKSHFVLVSSYGNSPAITNQKERDPRPNLWHFAATPCSNMRFWCYSFRWKQPKYLNLWRVLSHRQVVKKMRTKCKYEARQEKQNLATASAAANKKLSHTNGKFA